jgi:hypothetical protein
VKKLYVVTQPEAIRGVYESWPACQAAVAGVRGARYQAVTSRAQAERMLRGEPVVLAPGRYAFVDGNHMGGIGVVLVEQGGASPPAVREIATTVYRVFRDAPLPSLDTRSRVTAAINSLRNIVAELGALYAALGLARAGPLTVVHDYEGVGAWMEGRWQTRAPLVTEIVGACRALATQRGLRLRFHYQRGHESTHAGRNDYAAYHARADRLATEAALEPD